MERFAAFRHQNFRRYFVGQVISSVGTWLQALAVTWLVLDLTGRSDRLGVAVALQFLPLLLLGAPAGVLADRVDNRRLLMATSAVSAGLALAFGLVVSTGTADLSVIVELMSQVDKELPLDRMEATLKRDASLSFKLLRYLNSAAFGLPVEVTSFRHAMMLLGYPRLKRWLALLLTTASKDNAMRPVMWAALRRGLVMDATERDSMGASSPASRRRASS